MQAQEHSYALTRSDYVLVSDICMTFCSQNSSAERAHFPLYRSEDLLSFRYQQARGLFVHPFFTLKHSYFYFYYPIDKKSMN